MNAIEFIEDLELDFPATCSPLAFEAFLLKAVQEHLSDWKGSQEELEQAIKQRIWLKCEAVRIAHLRHAQAMLEINILLASNGWSQWADSLYDTGGL